jgi:hypothetical protein
MTPREQRGEFVSWKKRRAWMLDPDQPYTVTGERYGAVRPAVAGKIQPDAEVKGLDAALTWARERTNEKLGPPPLDNQGRPDVHPIESGVFHVRGTTGGVVFIVEGPPDPRGELPDWETVRYRERRPVEGGPGLVELVAEG